MVLPSGAIIIKIAWDDVFPYDSHSKLPELAEEESYAIVLGMSSFTLDFTGDINVRNQDDINNFSEKVREVILDVYKNLATWTY